MRNLSGRHVPEYLPYLQPDLPDMSHSLRDLCDSVRHVSDLSDLQDSVRYVSNLQDSVRHLPYAMRNVS